VQRDTAEIIATDRGQVSASWPCGQRSLLVREGLLRDVVRLPRRTGPPPDHQTTQVACNAAPSSTLQTDSHNTIQCKFTRSEAPLAVNHAVYNTYRRQRPGWSLSGIYKKRVRRETKGWVQEIRTYRARNRVHLLPGRSPGVIYFSLS